MAGSEETLGDDLIKMKEQKADIFVVILTAMSARYYLGELCLSSSSSTLVIDDTDIPALQQFTSALSVVEEEPPPFTIVGYPPTSTFAEQWADRRIWIEKATEDMIRRLYEEAIRRQNCQEVPHTLSWLWGDSVTRFICIAVRGQDRFLNPLVNGDYPEIVKKDAGNRILSFTKLESERIKVQLTSLA